MYTPSCNATKSQACNHADQYGSWQAQEYNIYAEREQMRKLACQSIPNIRLLRRGMAIVARRFLSLSCFLVYLSILHSLKDLNVNTFNYTLSISCLIKTYLDHSFIRPLRMLEGKLCPNLVCIISFLFPPSQPFVNELIVKNMSNRLTKAQSSLNPVRL